MRGFQTRRTILDILHKCSSRRSRRRIFREACAEDAAGSIIKFRLFYEIYSNLYFLGNLTKNKMPLSKDWQVQEMKYI